MVSIEVDDEGLSRLAYRCETQALRLGETAEPPMWVEGSQPSCAAVGAAHSAVVAAAAHLTARMRATTVAALSASADYAGAENSAASEIAAVGDGMASR